MPFDAYRNHDDPGLAPLLDSTRLAHGGAIDMMHQTRYRQRLHRLLEWLVIAFVYAVIGLWIVATP